MLRILPFLFLIVGTARAQDLTSVALRLADEHKIPSAAWAFVHADSVWTGAYGLANRESQLPVSADSTLFRIASVSKVFSATVAARMASAGLVDLDEVADGATLRQLLTHTSGYEDRTVGMFARSPEEVEPLGSYLSRAMPGRTASPGTLIRYSNHGAGLAGLRLAQAAGTSFADVVSDWVFEPAGMQISSFAQPFPGMDRLARVYPCDTCEAEPVDWRRAVPAGGMVTTASDMGRFMRRVLTDSTFAPDLFRNPTRMHPSLPGITLALGEMQVSGWRGYGHAGHSSGYRALLLLIPEMEVGLFAVTTGGQPDFGGALVEALELSLPSGPTTDTAEATALATAGPLQGVSGTYLQGRAPTATAESMMAVFIFSKTVVESDQGIRTSGTDYAPVGQDLWRSENGQLIRFDRDERGGVSAMHASQRFFGIDYPTSWTRSPRWKDPWLLNEALSWALGLPLLMLLIWPVTTVVSWGRWRFGGGRRRPSGARWWGIALVTAVPMVIFGFGFIARLNALLANDPGSVVYGLPSALASLTWVPWVCALTALVSVLATVVAWRRKAPPVARLGLTVTAIAALFFCGMLVHFHLLPVTW